MAKRLGLILVLVAIVVIAITVHRLSYAGRRDAWRAQGVEDYTWTLKVSEPIFGPRDLTVWVRDGEPVRAVLDGERVTVDEDQADGLPTTVDALFERLISAADDAVSLEVLWNDEFGYPTLIQLDASGLPDDEVTYEVVSFEAQEPS